MSEKAIKSNPSKYDDWQVRNALDTLRQAEEIQKDPKMMKLVAAELEKQQKVLSDVKDGISKLVNMSEKDYKKYLKDNKIV